MDKPQSILQVNTTDIGGGAAAIAFGLHKSYRLRGLNAWLAVGVKRSADAGVFEIPNDESRGAWARAWRGGAAALTPLIGRVRGADRTRTLLREIGSPVNAVKRRMGHEDFDFPGTWQILANYPIRPDVVHLHNLHGGYFDLRALAPISRKFPTLVTLHDSWMVAGHCAYSLACGRWESGCGNCPDLGLSPPLPRDATAGNWNRKRRVYSDSGIVVVSPSRWLAQIAQRSMLAEAAKKFVVINNGIDQHLFRPADKLRVRASLGMDPSKAIVVFAANGIRNNTYKDFPTLRAALAELSRTIAGREFEFIGVGEDGASEQLPNGLVRFVPHVDRSRLAQFYQAADIYVHAARADNFPNTILEALSCGTPVVATAVGGIPEQVKPLRDTPFTSAQHDSFSAMDATGILTGPGEGEKLGSALSWLLGNPHILSQLAGNAARDAVARFNIERQVDDYLALYEEMIAQHPEPASARGAGG